MPAKYVYMDYEREACGYPAELAARPRTPAAAVAPASNTSNNNYYGGGSSSSSSSNITGSNDCHGKAGEGLDGKPIPQARRPSEGSSGDEKEKGEDKKGKQPMLSIRQRWAMRTKDDDDERAARAARTRRAILPLVDNPNCEEKLRPRPVGDEAMFEDPELILSRTVDGRIVEVRCGGAKRKTFGRMQIPRRSQGLNPYTGEPSQRSHLERYRTQDEMQLPGQGGSGGGGGGGGSGEGEGAWRPPRITMTPKTAGAEEGEEEEEEEYDSERTLVGTESDNEYESDSDEEDDEEVDVDSPLYRLWFSIAYSL